MKIRIVKGNKKLPSSTYILNMCSAAACPSLKLGLCQACGKCYAMKAERQYPDVRKARAYDRKAWKENDAESIAAQLLESSRRARSNRMKAFRFSEAGDFETQADVDKMSNICAILLGAGVSCYGYSARTDLDLSRLVKVAYLNVSNDGGQWTDHGANRFRMVPRASGNSFVRVGDCRKCTVCQRVRGKVIEVVEH